MEDNIIKLHVIYNNKKWKAEIDEISLNILWLDEDNLLSNHEVLTENEKQNLEKDIIVHIKTTALKIINVN